MKKVFAIPIFFLFIVFFTGYVLFPKYQQVGKLEKEIKERKNLLTLISQELNQGMEELANYEESIEKVKTAIPEEISLADLFNFFQKKSSENGLALEGIGLGAQGGGTQTSDIPTNQAKEDYFSLDVSGSYPSLKSFLKTFEGSSRLFEVEDISIGQSDETGETEETAETDETAPGILHYNILIKVYSR